MADFGPQIIDSVLAACQAGAGEIASGLSRTLDVAIEVTAAEASTFAVAAEQLGDAPGLLVILNCGGQAAIVALSQTCGLLPDWCAAPDSTGKSKLTTLAQELGMLVLPETFMPEDFQAQYVKPLLEAIRAGQPPSDAGTVALKLRAGEKSATAWMIWPLDKPSEMLVTAQATVPQPVAASSTAAPLSSTAVAAATVAVAKQVAVASPQPTILPLPLFTRSLLHIRVPVTVSLATKKQPLGNILDLGPGSIIHFMKSCEEMLELQVGGRPVALGEAVKVGDKFGLRLTSMILPEERFKVVGAGNS